MIKDDQIKQAKNYIEPITHYVMRNAKNEVITIYCGSTSGHTRNICGFISQAEYEEVKEKI